MSDRIIAAFGLAFALSVLAAFGCLVTAGRFSLAAGVLIGGCGCLYLFDSLLAPHAADDTPSRPLGDDVDP